MGDLRYNSYATYIRNRFGQRLQKVAVDAGFSCPNRSGGDAYRRSEGGCIFCNNNAFNPSYCTPEKSIGQQIDEGIEFHRHRYPDTKLYLAYFQPYSNTFAPLETLKQRYEEALNHPKTAGIIIGTRPDCIDEEKLDYFASLSDRCEFVAIEYGIESCYDNTLRTINRGHTFADTRRAIEMTHQRGIHCGAHLIMGLPGETREMMLDEASIVGSLPIDSLKLHQLQIIKGTPLAENDTALCDTAMDITAYIGLVCDFLERLDPRIMMERFAGEVPPRFQAYPERAWRHSDGRYIRNEEIPIMVNNELLRRDSRQGAKCNYEF